MNWTIFLSLLGGVVLLGLIILYFVWRYYVRMLKLFAIGMVFMVLSMGAVVLYYFNTYSVLNRPNPAIGKHAYLANGKYLGVIAGDGVDNRRGEVWKIKRPYSNYPQVFSKARITIKGERDISSEPTPEPSPSPSPSTSPTPKPKIRKRVV